MREISWVLLGRENRSVGEIPIAGLRFGHSGASPRHRIHPCGDRQRLIQCFRDGSSFLPGRRHRKGAQNLQCGSGRGIRRLSRLQQLRTVQR